MNASLLSAWLPVLDWTEISAKLPVKTLYEPEVDQLLFAPLSYRQSSIDIVLFNVPDVFFFRSLSLFVWDLSASSYSSSHFLSLYFINSYFFYPSFSIFLFAFQKFFPFFWLVCSHVFHPYHRAGLWLAAVCHMASCATDLSLVSRLQWVVLSGPWVGALLPQVLQPLAGCTGAYPGQVPSTTCVPLLPPSPTTEYAWGSVFLPTCTIQWSASPNWMFYFIITLLSVCSLFWWTNIYIILYFS